MTGYHTRATCVLSWYLSVPTSFCPQSHGSGFPCHLFILLAVFLHPSLLASPVCFSEVSPSSKSLYCVISQLRAVNLLFTMEASPNSVGSSLDHSGRLCCALALQGQSGPQPLPQPSGIYKKVYAHLIYICMGADTGAFV